MPTRSLLAAVVAAAALTTAAPALAAPGDLDPAFGTDGVTLLDGEQAVAVLPLDGGASVVVQDSFRAERVDAKGAADPGFNTVVTFGTGDAVATDAARDAQGRIVIAGYARGSSEDRQVAVARLTPEGVLDPTFDGDGRKRFDFPGGAPELSRGEGVALDAQGRILVGGARGEAPGQSSLAVARLLDDGSLDGAFSGDGVATADPGAFDEAMGVKAAPDGGVVLAGTTADADGGRFTTAVARFTADGAPDPAFGGGDGVALPEIAALGDDAWHEVLALGLRADGRILIGGSAFNSNDTLAFVTALRPDGTVDEAFATKGAWLESFGTFSAEVVDLEVRPDGAAYAVGFAEGVSETTGSDGFVTRLTAAGAPDPRFGTAGTRLYAFTEGTASDEVSALGAWPGGRLLLAGSTVRGLWLRAVVAGAEGVADGPPLGQERPREETPGPRQEEPRKEEPRRDERPPAGTLPLPVPDPAPRVITPARTAQALVDRIRGRSPRRFSGTATGTPAKVQVALTRKGRGRCSAVRSTDAKLVKSRCSAPRWLAAKGTSRWTLSLRRALPKGSYELLVRPVGADGTTGTATRRSFRVA